MFGDQMTHFGALRVMAVMGVLLVLNEMRKIITRRKLHMWYKESKGVIPRLNINGEFV